jgi:hypothetical protein
MLGSRQGLADPARERHICPAHRGGRRAVCLRVGGRSSPARSAQPAEIKNETAQEAAASERCGGLHGHDQRAQLVLHLLFNALADSGPAASRAQFKELFRKFANGRMRDFIAAAQPEELRTFEETALAEIANSLSDREWTN